MAGSLPPLDLALLLIRLVWAAAVSVSAGLTGQLTTELAVIVGLWVLLIVVDAVVPWLGIRSRWQREFAIVFDFIFVLGSIALTGLATSPLWWSLLIGALLGGMAFGWIAALGFPSLGATVLLAFGFISGSIEVQDLASSGRALLTVLVLTPVTGWIGVWLQKRLQSNPGGGAGDDRSMLDLAMEMNTAVAAEDFPEQVIDLALGGLAADRAEELRAALLLPVGGGFSLAAGRNATPERLVMTTPNGLIGEAVDTGQIRHSDAASQDPALEQLGLAQGSREAVCVPLIMNEQVEGALVLAHSTRGFFSRGRLMRLDAIATQASIALHNARIVRALEVERDRITETEEEARRKLARNLHDGPTQTIAAIAMRLNFAGRLVERDREAAQEEIKTLEEIARQTTKEIRHMLFALRPLVLESKGLISALYQLASKMHETHGQAVYVEAESNVSDGLDMSKQAVVFFIAEEAINNAHKHAEAANIWVELQRTEADSILLEVRDDGVGFNVGAVDANYEQRGSLGMVNMRERSELVNGVLRIESAEGEGTRIILEVRGTT
ncbi:MAG: GAF domain-containing sensor histidine kinase [Anaerolineales bacterium]